MRERGSGSGRTLALAMATEAREEVEVTRSRVAIITITSIFEELVAMRWHARGSEFWEDGLGWCALMFFVYFY